eukprot:g29325.t1
MSAVMESDLKDKKDMKEDPKNKKTAASTKQMMATVSWRGIVPLQLSLVTWETTDNPMAEKCCQCSPFLLVPPL